jgi:hypothetical protein
LAFHLELRQFPHTARAFNLSREELHARFVSPWTHGDVVELDEQKFAPERARLTIYEGPRLPTEELGYGRGWGNATRTGEDVTDRELGTWQATAPASDSRGPVTALKDELAALCEVGTVTVPQALALATGAAPRARVSARLAMAEQAVWELLHEGRLNLLRAGGEPLRKEEWEAALLASATWFESPPRLLLGQGG